MKWLLLLIPFASASAHVINSQFEVHNTVDNLNYNQLTYSYESGRNDPFWPYKKEDDRFFRFKGSYVTGDLSGKKFDAHAFSFGYLQKINDKLVLDGDGGISQTGNDGLTPLLRLRARSSYEYLLTTLEYYSRPLFYEQLPEAGYFQRIRRQTLSWDNVLRAGEHFRTPFRLAYNWDSSTNKKSELDVKILGGASWPYWIWAGPFYSGLWNSKQINSYWTPKNFISWGGYAEAGIPIRKFTLLGSASVGRVKEFNSFWQTSKKMSAGLRYGDREEGNYECRVSKTSTEKVINGWGETAVNCNLNVNF